MTGLKQDNREIKSKAYVIAVCGAGGKTSYIKAQAKEASALSLRVAVTTTTHILREKGAEKTWELFMGEKKLLCIEQEGICYIGRLCEEEDKLIYPGDGVYEKILEHFDLVLVEADGAKHFPMKLPDLSREPVIPKGTDEIVVVMGRHAIGRRLGTVCHRAYLLEENCQKEKKEADSGEGIAGQGSKGQQAVPFCCLDREALKRFSNGVTKDSIATEELLLHLMEHGYKIPLQKRFPQAKFTFHLSDGVCTEKRKFALILMASGFGRRFGGNKLLAAYQGKPLYQRALDVLLETAEKLNREAEVFLVTRYTEISKTPYVQELLKKEKLTLCENKEYAEGISASVRLGAKQGKERGCTDFLYMAADMPGLSAEDLLRYLYDYMRFGKRFALMQPAEDGRGGVPGNPGILSAKAYDEIMEIHGDKGGMQVIKRHPDEIYYHAIEAEKLRDIDTKADLSVKAGKG